MRILKKIAGWVLMIGGLPLAIVVLADIIKPDPTDTTGTGMKGAILVFFGGLAVAGFFLVRSARSRSQVDAAAQREAITLKLAGESDGTLGPTELAARGGMTFVEAQAELERLAKLGACELVVTEKGATFYRFPDLLTPHEARATAKGLLES